MISSRPIPDARVTELGIRLNGEIQTMKEEVQRIRSDAANTRSDLATTIARVGRIIEYTPSLKRIFENANTIVESDADYARRLQLDEQQGLDARKYPGGASHSGWHRGTPRNRNNTTFKFARSSTRRSVHYSRKKRASTRVARHRR